MKVFITGGTGFVGSRTLDLLLEHKHDVTALVRKEKDAEALKGRGVKPVLGDLSSLDTIAAESKHADAVVHLAFIHDFSAYEESLKTETRVLEVIISALAGTGKKLLATSGAVMGGDSGAGLQVEAGPGEHARGVCEAAALKGIDQGVKVFLLRLPIYVYDSSAFVSFMLNVQVEVAKKQGRVSYISSGAQKFSVAHVKDVASAYVAAAENGTTPGIYNVASEQGITALQLASATAKKLGLPEEDTQSISMEKGQELYHGLAFLFAMNADVDISKAHADFKWQPAATSGFLSTVAKSGTV